MPFCFIMYSVGGACMHNCNSNKLMENSLIFTCAVVAQKDELHVSFHVFIRMLSAHSTSASKYCNDFPYKKSNMIQNQIKFLSDICRMKILPRLSFFDLAQ